MGADRESSATRLSGGPLRKARIGRMSGACPLVFRAGGTYGAGMSDHAFPHIEVRGTAPLPLMSRVEGVYIDRFGAEPESRGGWYEPDAWRRVSRVYERLDKGGHVLDVGSGAGQFANCLAWSGEFASVTTIDTAHFSKYIELSDDIQRHNMSVGDMSFDDDSFDVVTCMEVLEHVPEEVLEPGIAELRRVCRGQLVITVPYREPEPLSATHVRRFEDDDLLRLFPDAEFAILNRPNKPWVMIQERFDGKPNEIPLDDATDAGLLRTRITALEAELAALRRRKVLRAANLAGRSVRRARRTAGTVAGKAAKKIRR